MLPDAHKDPLQILSDPEPLWHSVRVTLGEDPKTSEPLWFQCSCGIMSLVTPGEDPKTSESLWFQSACGIMSIATLGEDPKTSESL